jgi:hypothetical protein
VARKHGLTAKQLAWYNPKPARLKSGNLAPGQRLLIPTAATVSAAIDVPDPSIERFPRRAKASPAGAAKKSSGKSSAKAAPAKKGTAGKQGAVAKKPTAKKKGAPTKKTAPAKKPAATKKPADK